MKHHFYINEKLFELFCVKIDFAKYSEKCQNLVIQIFCSTLL